MTDEEVLERAFLSALQNHFKKPSIWKYEQFTANKAFVVPSGKVYEVFIYCSGADIIYDLKDRILIKNCIFPTGPGLEDSFIGGNWFPAYRNYTDTAYFDTVAAAEIRYINLALVVMPEGYIWYPTEGCVNKTAGMFIKYRERYDKGSQ